MAKGDNPGNGVIQINCNVSGVPSDIPRIQSDSGVEYFGAFELNFTRCVFKLDTTTPPAGWGATLLWSTNRVRLVVPVNAGAYEGSSLELPTIVYSVYPPPPTREQAMEVNISFMGGIIVDSPIYGKMPWYLPALSWCDKVTRQRVYEQMYAIKDTHAIIEVPNGKPLYNEGGQFYSPDKFPALDWTNGETKLDSRFSELVDEVIGEGFKFIINMDELQPNSIRVVQLVMEALSDKQLQYGFTMPGYDGVFYGWPNDQVTIPDWARVARSIKPNCILGIEFNVGHIPLSHGEKDYAHGGLMDGFDITLGEFEFDKPLNTLLHLPNDYYGNQIWQVVARNIKPYHKPPDQPANADSSNPPFYLTDSPRGPRRFCFFETSNPYNWVRVNPNDQNAVNKLINTINSNRQYARNLGCKYLG